jgi:peptide/nickel transport system ATP-binding protein
VLSARGLRFRFDRRGPDVVAGLDLDLARGEVVGLRGASGRGKTTLGRLLSGYLRADAGTVTVDGAPLPRSGRCPVQLVFQHPELAVDPRWRLHEILAEAGEATPELLEQLSIHEGWLTRFPHELSGGELQRIAVARALVTGAPYLVADEISAMLDPLTQAQLWHALRARADAGTVGVLAVSHDAALLDAVADRVIDLDPTPQPAPATERA